MSAVQVVRAFLQKANREPALKARIQASQGADRQANIAALVSIGKETGYHFTSQEYETALKDELSRQFAAGELTEEELDTVAAAGFCKPPKTSAVIGTFSVGE